MFTNSKNDRSLLSCLKVTQGSTSKIAAVQPMLSISYDHRTIASTLKMQIQTVQHLRAQLNTSDDPLEMVERKPKAENTVRKTWTKEFIKKVQAIIDETPQWPIRQIARDLGISHTTVKHVWRRTWSVGPKSTRQAESWLRRQRTSG